MTDVRRKDAPTLETTRLLLRAWRPEEIAWYVALRADPEVSRFVHPQSAGEVGADFDWAIAEWARTGIGGWAVEEHSTGILVGYLGLPLWRKDTPKEAVEIGYGYAREAWGKGYATEAAAAALRWAFEVRALDSLVALTAPENHASQHVLSKVGFRRDGEAEGQHCRALLFRLARADFEASWGFRSNRATSD